MERCIKLVIEVGAVWRPEPCQPRIRIPPICRWFYTDGASGTSLQERLAVGTATTGIVRTYNIDLPSTYGTHYVDDAERLEEGLVTSSSRSSYVLKT